MGACTSVEGGAKLHKAGEEQLGHEGDRVAERFGSASAIHQKFMLWSKDGFFEHLWRAGFAEYDQLEAVAWRWHSIDGAMFKTPLARRRWDATPRIGGKRVASTWRLSDKGNSSMLDTLSQVERLQSSDKKIALDLTPTGKAGQALEFIGLIAPKLITSPEVLGVILNLFDQGKSLHDVCQLALDMGLVSSIAGSSSNAALAAMVYRNLTEAEASPAVLDILVGFMDGRSASFSQADFMSVVAGLELNQTHIGLVGLQQTGVEYL